MAHATPDPDNPPDPEAAARAYRAAARAPATRAGHAAARRAYTAWGGALPAAPAPCARFAAELARRGYAVATIRARLAGLAAWHRAHGHPDPTKHALLAQTLRGIARRHASPPAQARGLTAADTAAIAAATGAHPRDLRDLAMLRVARDLLARRAELVALDVGDLALDGDHGTATLPRAKTDGQPGYLGPESVAALNAYLAATGIAAGALFRALATGRRLSPRDVARRFKALAARAGIDHATVSGHSARVGMAQDLAANGASLVALQTAGRWRAPTMPARYTRHQAARHGAVARYHAGRGA